MLSAAAVVTASVLSRPMESRAADTLMGIEKLRSRVKDSGSEYVILEVVPDHRAAEIGFYFDGYEPVIGEWTEPVYSTSATGETELATPEEWKSWKDLLIEEETDRTSFISELKGTLQDYYTQQGFTDGPVTASADTYGEIDIDENPDAAAEGYEEIAKSSIEKEGWFTGYSSSSGASDRFHLVFAPTVASENYDAALDPDLQYTVVAASEESISSYLVSGIALSLEGEIDSDGEGDGEDEGDGESETGSGTELDINQITNYALSSLSRNHDELYRTPVYTKDAAGVYHYAGTFSEIESRLPEMATRIISVYNLPSGSRPGSDPSISGSESSGSDPSISGNDIDSAGDGDEDDEDDKDDEGSGDSGTTGEGGGTGGSEGSGGSGGTGGSTGSVSEGSGTGGSTGSGSEGSGTGGSTGSGSEGNGTGGSGTGSEGSGTGGSGTGSGSEGNGTGSSTGNSEGSGNPGGTGSNEVGGDPGSTGSTGSTSNSNGGAPVTASLQGQSAAFSDIYNNKWYLLVGGDTETLSGNSLGSGDPGDGDDGDDGDGSGEPPGSTMSGNSLGGPQNTEEDENNSGYQVNLLSSSDPGEEEYYFVQFKKVSDYATLKTGASQQLYKVSDIVRSKFGEYVFSEYDPLTDSDATYQKYMLPGVSIWCKNTFKNAEWFKKYVLNMEEADYDSFPVKVLS